MKHYALLAIFFTSLLNINVYGQSSPFLSRYDYSKQPDAAYTPLTPAAFQFNLPEGWDDEFSDAVDMPFPFFYQNVLVGNIKATGNGSLMLNGAINPDADLGNIVGLSMDYESKGRGKVLYEIDGSTPNRVLKIEYQNVGLFDDTLNVDSLNYQIWLYEGSDVIEYRAGYSNLPDSQFAQNDDDFFVQQKKVLHMGLFQNTGDMLSENPDNIYFQCIKKDDVDSLVYFPDLLASGSENAYVKASYKKFPAEGSMFRFTPRDETTTIKEPTIISSKVYPNPSKTGKFTVLLGHVSMSDYRICDIKGSLKEAGTFHGGRLEIDLSTRTKGIYVVTIVSEGHTEYVKLIYQ